MCRSTPHILFMALWLGAYLPATAQRVQRQPQHANQPTTNPVRAEALYQANDLRADDTRWMREVYRQLDLETEEKNMPLYFPSESSDGEANLFTILFRLVCANKLLAYEYLDGKELFTDSARIGVKDILDKFHIQYTESGSGRVQTYRIDDSDIPGAEVKSYYIKEKYYFDHRSSEYKVTIEAICPLLHRDGEFGEEVVKYPMFWIQYGDLRPYLLNARVMTGNENNAVTQSIDDYLVKRQYKGDIYKTTNLRNLTLMQYCPTPDSLARERARIEIALNSFEKELWRGDTTLITPSNSVTNKRSNIGDRRKTTSKSSATAAKEVKAKSDNSSRGGAVRSVRRR